MSGMVNLHHIEIVRQYGQTIASRCAGAHPVRRGAHPKTGAALWKIPRKKPRHRRAHGFAAERTYGHPPRGGGVQHVKIPIYIMHIHPGSRCRLMPSYETRETASQGSCPGGWCNNGEAVVIAGTGRYGQRVGIKPP